MQASNFEIQNYLEHIGFQGRACADLKTLTELMRLQLRKVPFENLDVQAGKVVSLVPEDIVEKILVRHRGGYCYEVNGLFSMALQALGIEHFYVAARPMFYAERRPKTHMAIVAKLEEELWLCDLGFGSYGLRQPMSLKTIDVDVCQDLDCYKVSMQSDGEYLLLARMHGKWVAQYAFDLQPHEWLDFAPANFLNSKHPEAIFVKQLLVILQTQEGRKILSNRVFKNWVNGKLSERMLEAQEVPTVLREEFGLPMS
jgi:N-hydroxyarylamine O-acetyltransferase